MIVARTYTLHIVGEIGLISPQYIIAAVVLSIALGALYAFLLRKRTHWASMKSYLPLLQGAALGLLAIRLWPHLWGDYLGLLLSPVGIVGAFGGFALLLTRDATLRGLPVLGLFLGSALFYLQSLRPYPFMPWAFRRYVPVILPMALLFTGHFIATIWNSRTRLRAFVVLVPALLSAAFLVKSWPIMRDPPMREAYAAVAQFAALFPPTALLLFDRSAPSHLPLAVDYTFGRQALAIYRLENLQAALRDLIRSVFAVSRPVYVVTMGQEGEGGNSLWRSDLPEFALRPASTFPLRYTALEWTRDVFPQIVRPVEQNLELYQVLPLHDPAARVALPLVIDLGTLDFPYLLSGFYARESWGPITTRWTRGEAHLIFPPLAIPASRRATLILRATGSRPPRVAPPRVTLTINGTPMGQFTAATNDFAVYRFPFPPHVLAKGRDAGLVLTLRTPTFVPKAVGLNDDPRELGIALDWVKVEEGSSERQEK